LPYELEHYLVSSLDSSHKGFIFELLISGIWYTCTIIDPTNSGYWYIYRKCKYRVEDITWQVPVWKFRVHSNWKYIINYVHQQISGKNDSATGTGSPEPKVSLDMLPLPPVQKETVRVGVKRKSCDSEVCGLESLTDICIFSKNGEHWDQTWYWNVCHRIFFQISE